MKQLLGPDGRPFARPAPAESRGRPGPWTLRRWEAGKTDRLNEAHWASVNDQAINSDLAGNLSILRSRAIYESTQNPTVDGAIRTFARDVAGRNGPILRVRSDDRRYSEALEQAWADLWDRIEYRGLQAGVDVLKLYVRNLLDSGEFFSQETYDESATSALKFRVKPIHPRRVDTPPAMIGQANVVMGVQQDAGGKPVMYYVARPVTFGAYTLYTGEYDAVPARDCLHGFMLLEADQSRGVPILATPLPSIADARDYDRAVVKAAKNAAKLAIAWSSNSPDVDFQAINEETEIPEDAMFTGPNGYTPTMLNPTQPQQTYEQFKADKQRDIGAPIGMPNLILRNDASKHNYSSARFDAQTYVKGVDELRAWFERRVLSRWLERVEAEARIAGIVPRRPMGRVRVSWIWPAVMKHVDPAKEAAGDEIQLRNGTAAWSELVARDGKDPDAVFAQIVEDAKRFREAGLPIPGTQPGDAPALPSEELEAMADEEGVELSATGAKRTPKPADAKAAEAVPALSLNGAQILAAVDVMGKLRDGVIVPAAAIELLVAVGLERKNVEAMVAATPIGRDDSADATTFRRELVKTLIGGSTTAGDTLARGTKVDELAEATGLPFADPGPAPKPDPVPVPPIPPATAAAAKPADDEADDDEADDEEVDDDDAEGDEEESA